MSEDNEDTTELSDDELTLRLMQARGDVPKEVPPPWRPEEYPQHGAWGYDVIAREVSQALGLTGPEYQCRATIQTTTAAMNGLLHSASSGGGAAMWLPELFPRSGSGWVLPTRATFHGDASGMRTEAELVPLIRALDPGAEDGTNPRGRILLCANHQICAYYARQSRLLKSEYKQVWRETDMKGWRPNTQMIVLHADRGDMHKQQYLVDLAREHQLYVVRDHYEKRFGAPPDDDPSLPPGF